MQRKFSQTNSLHVTYWTLKMFQNNKITLLWILVTLHNLGGPKHFPRWRVNSSGVWQSKILKWPHGSTPGLISEIFRFVLYANIICHRCIVNFHQTTVMFENKTTECLTRVLILLADLCGCDCKPNVTFRIQKLSTLVRTVKFFYKYGRIKFPAVYRQRVWCFAFHNLILTLHKIAADIISPHKWGNFHWLGPTCSTNQETTTGRMMSFGIA